MNEKKKPTYKEINGISRVGNFLKKIGQSKIWDLAVKIAKDSNVPVLETLGKILDKDKELNQRDKEIALEMLDFDIKENEEITKRWQSDMLSDSFLSKNIRPMVLAFSWILVAAVILFKSELKTELITLLSTLSLAINVAYFGGRTWLQSKQVK